MNIRPTTTQTVPAKKLIEQVANNITEITLPHFVLKHSGLSCGRRTQCV